MWTGHHLGRAYISDEGGLATVRAVATCKLMLKLTKEPAEILRWLSCAPELVPGLGARSRQQYRLSACKHSSLLGPVRPPRARPHLSITWSWSWGSHRIQILNTVCFSLLHLGSVHMTTEVTNDEYRSKGIAIWSDKHKQLISPIIVPGLSGEGSQS